MLPFPIFSPVGDDSLLGIITALGLQSNLKLCLDAGDLVSYSGSGQSWLDRSGGGYDWFRGADGSATATDPTFNGTAGGLSLSEYWSFDGGDYFTYDTTNEAWMSNIHKDNAAFTMLFIMYPIAGTSNQRVWSNTNTSSEVGSELLITSSETLQFYTTNGSGGYPINKTTDGSVSGSAWQFIAVSLNEATGAGGGFFWRNGAYMQVSSADTFDSTANTPSSSAATYTTKIGTDGNVANSGFFNNGTRLAGVAIWEGTRLTKANLDDLYSRLRGRFGL